MRTRRLFMISSGLFCVVALAGLSSSWGQEEREGRRQTYRSHPGRNGEARPQSEDSQSGNADAHLADWLLIDNQVQLAIIRFAADRAKRESVQDFADELIEAHNWIIQQLAPIAGSDDQPSKSMRASSSPPNRMLTPDRQRIRATAADEVREKEETRPVPETKAAARGTGQESGPTGTRARDVRQGENGTDDARTITEPAPRFSRYVESRGPAGVGTRGRTGVSGTTGDEMRTHDRRLDAFDRVGSLPVTEQNRRDDDSTEEKRARLRIAPRLGIGPSSRAVSSNLTDAAIIMDDIGRQRVELTKRELGRFRGESFDRAFLQHQIVAHMYSLSLIRGVKGHVGSELQEMLDEAEDSNWSHLSRAKEVLHEMELVPSQVTR